MGYKISFFTLIALNIIVATAFFLSTDYSKEFFIINLVSFIILWFYLIKKLNLGKFFVNHKKDICLSVAVFLIALSVYLYRVDAITPGMWGDEVTVAATGEKILKNWNSIPFVNLATGYTKPYLFLQGMFIKTFGRNLIAIRLPSILFGAIECLFFYLFLRMFFKKSVSFISALLMALSYPNIIVSRLAYDITAALLFEILTLAFVYLFYKTSKTEFLLGVGLCLGAGLFTYVGFRTFSLMAIFAIAVIVYAKKSKPKEKIREVFLVTGVLFISISSLIGFGVSQPKTTMARVRSLSVFGQNLPSSEVVKEIGAALLRTGRVFFPQGDPSARSNPSGAAMFDVFTGLLLSLGLIYLYKNKRKIFWFSLLFAFPFFVNDIFSLERIPEFHYYGLGHPNTYRVSGIIPIFFFWVAWGFVFLEKLLGKLEKQSIYLQSILAIIIVFISINKYFYQAKINPKLFQYNYIFNGAASLEVVDIIEKSGLNQVSLSKSFYEDPRINYFSGDKIKLKLFEPENENQALNTVRSEELIALDPKDNLDLAKILVSNWQKDPTSYFLHVEKYPSGEASFLILSKAN